MYIKKLVKRGLAVCTFLCAMSAVSSWAASAGNICFLPSGECSEDSVHVKTVTVTRGGDVPTNKDCGAEGYNYGRTDSWNNPPDANPSNCSTSCGTNAPKYCVSSCRTKDRIYYSCDTEDPTSDKPYVWSYKDLCGGDLYTQEAREELVGNCYTWVKKTTATGQVCYRYKEHPEFVPEDVKKAEYDESCYKFTPAKDCATADNGGIEKGCFIADGNLRCFKPERRTCEEGEYLEILTAEGVVPEKCACKAYELDFSIKENGKRGVTPSLSADLTFGPKEETKIVDVTSLEHGDGDDVVVPYTIPSVAVNCNCTIEKISKGTQLKITCAANTTGNTLKCNVTAKQDTSSVRATNRPGDAVITLTVNPDSCPGDLSLEPVCTEGYQAKADETQTSETGQACYKCLNDVCEGDAISGETPEPKEGYVTTHTEFGSECYIPRICPVGFSTEFQSTADCTKNNHPEGWSFNDNGYSGDKLCGKCTPTVCNGDGYVEKCIPDPERLCEDLNAESCPWTCVTVQAGDDTLYNCNPAACTKGSTAIKTTANCTSNGHPEGWTIKEVAKSGNESCNECEPKVCVGEGFDHKCEPQPRCLNVADENCGYKDITPEYEGDTPKYNSNDKECPAGYSVEFQSENDCTKNGHPEGWNFDQKGKSGELTCGRCTPKVCTGMGRQVQCKPNPLCAAGTTCGFKDFITEYEGDTPKYDANIIPCETGYSTETTSCSGNFTLKTNGVAGNAAGETKACGKCVCEKTVTGNWTLDESTCTPVCSLPEKANYAIVNCEYVCNLPQKANYAIVNCEYVCDLPEKDGYKIENCEYVPLGPTSCQKTGNGSFGDGCCVDADCGNGDEFQLYCFAAKSDDNKSTKSCRECGAFSDCKLFSTDMTRYERKCAATGDCRKLGDKKYTYKDGYGGTALIWQIWDKDLNSYQVVVNHNQKSDGSWGSGDYYTTYGTGKVQQRFSCRKGECTSYDAGYTYDSTKEAEDRDALAKAGYNTAKIDEKIATKYKLAAAIKALGADSDGDSKCPAGSTKAYPSGCSADEAVSVGTTTFGSFCWACKK